MSKGRAIIALCERCGRAAQKQCTFAALWARTLHATPPPPHQIVPYRCFMAISSGHCWFFPEWVLFCNHQCNRIYQTRSLRTLKISEKEFSVLGSDVAWFCRQIAVKKWNGQRGPGSEADHSPPPTAGLKKEWSCTSSPLWTYMAWWGTSLQLKAWLFSGVAFLIM